MLKRIVLVLVCFALLATPAYAARGPNQDRYITPGFLGLTNDKILTPSSPTTCTSIFVGFAPIVTITNVGSAMTVFPQLYDEAGSPTCDTGDRIFGNGATLTLQTGQSINLWVPALSGIAYNLSGALSDNLVIAW